MTFYHITRQYVLHRVAPCSYLTLSGEKRVHRPHVRRRAILAFRALSVYDPELLKRVASKVQKRLRDPEPSVIGAALVVSSEVVRTSSCDLFFHPHALYRLGF